MYDSNYYVDIIIEDGSPPRMQNFIEKPVEQTTNSCLNCAHGFQNKKIYGDEIVCFHDSDDYYYLRQVKLCANWKQRITMEVPRHVTAGLGYYNSQGEDGIKVHPKPEIEAVNEKARKEIYMVFYLMAQSKKREAINDYITDMFSGRMRVHGTTHLREKKNNEK